MVDRKISVVIPYYKGKEYIAQTIASVADQPYKNLEILLINDGSPDDGDEVCRSLAAKYPCIRYFKKENEGIGATRNFGVDHSVGEYIAFLDQDDVWVKDFLDEDTVDAVFNGGDAVCFSLYNCNHDFSRGRKDSVLDTVMINEGLRASSEIWRHHSSIFFRRKTILEHEILAPSTRHEDEIFRRKFLYVSEKVTCINKVMFLYRNNPSSETHRMIKVEDLYGPILQSYKEALAWHQEKYPKDLDIHRVYKTLFCLYAIEGLELLYASHRKKAEIEKVANERFLKDDVIEYMGSTKDDGLCNRIGEYLYNPRSFARKNSIKGYKQKCARLLKKIPFVNSYYQKKKYPTDLSSLGLL